MTSERLTAGRVQLGTCPNLTGLQHIIEFLLQPHSARLGRSGTLDPDCTKEATGQPPEITSAAREVVPVAFGALHELHGPCGIAVQLATVEDGAELEGPAAAAFRNRGPTTPRPERRGQGRALPCPSSLLLSRLSACRM
jgi:hypothetical protein